MGGSMIYTGEVVEKCFGCAHMFPDTRVCKVYMNASAKWSAGNCPMATHLKKKVEQVQKALDPIKASKRKMGK